MRFVLDVLEAVLHQFGPAVSLENVKMQAVITLIRQQRQAAHEAQQEVNEREGEKS